MEQVCNKNHLGSFLVAICHSDVEMSLQKLVKIMSKISQKIKDLLLSKCIAQIIVFNKKQWFQTIHALEFQRYSRGKNFTLDDKGTKQL